MCGDTSTATEIDDIESLSANWIWAKDIISGRDTIPPLVSSDPPNITSCGNWVRDVSRVLLLISFVCQISYFQYVFTYYVENNAAVSKLYPLWVVTIVLSLGTIIGLLIVPRIFTYSCIGMCSTSRQIGTVFQPLNKYSLYAFLFSTNGDAFIVHYVAWIVYVCVYLSPRIYWLVLDTTADVLGHIIPHSFLAFTFIVNMCFNLSYLYNKTDAEREQPFEVVYELLQSTKKSILEILDIMSVCNELGVFQKHVTLSTYLYISVPVMLVATLLLIGITLEVTLKFTSFWNFTTLSSFQQSMNRNTRRYSRTSILLFCLFLLLQIVADLVLLLFRLTTYLLGMVELTNFIYKNMFYLFIHLTHIYSVIMLLPINPESTYAALPAATM
ncbi:uncharacterized protein LOC135828541 [Sycon ciliatum]|uniref:uncharacterized protein LOC135828541 n=1 Tax=Sycon ciliatum TaxID=27933 RepID=UPI0020AB27F2|eukprot:scpid83782/ scgid9358/ 